MLNDIESAYAAANLVTIAQQLATDTNYAHNSPAAVFRPALSIDGDQWCALYGDNLQDGVAGFGDSPELAMQDFNRNWAAKLKPRATSQEQAK